jgi:hypothetical protein
MNRRLAKPRVATKINSGKGITIRAADVHFPTYEHRIKFDYDGKQAFLVITHEYNAERGYGARGTVELDGKKFDDAAYFESTHYDLWYDFINVHFENSYMANRHTYEVPKMILALIEKRVALLATGEAPTVEGK